MSMEPSGGLGNLGSGKTTLGSLAQSARNKHINQARGVLIFIGIITMLNCGREMAVLANNPGNADPDQLQSTQLVLGIAFGEGVAFFVLGLLTRKYAVPATILGLILYTADTAIMLGSGVNVIWIVWVFKIAIIVALIKAVQSAIAYQRELKATAYQADPLA